MSRYRLSQVSMHRSAQVLHVLIRVGISHEPQWAVQIVGDPSLSLPYPQQRRPLFFPFQYPSPQIPVVPTDTVCKVLTRVQSFELRQACVRKEGK